MQPIVASALREIGHEKNPKRSKPENIYIYIYIEKRWFYYNKLDKIY